MNLTNLLRDLASNDTLWIAILTGMLAQFLKPFTYWLRTGEFNWHHISATGGMPSSHSAMVSALAAGVGLHEGFGSPAFATTVVLAMIVTYDAAGVRRAAGEHARRINHLIAELLSGHPIQQIKLKEVLGHNRREAAAGVLFGAFVMLAWKLLVQPLFL
jgi:acid phosphatase family membrane protein YuiD